MSTPARRLEDLRRQRGLVEQQLAALDREIAAVELAARADDSASRPAGAPFVRTSSHPTLRAVPDTDAEAILDHYRSSGTTLKTDVRKGCLLYAAGAFALLVALVLGLYFVLRH